MASISRRAWVCCVLVHSIVGGEAALFTRTTPKADTIQTTPEG
jgi:hypothetical protein